MATSEPTLFQRFLRTFTHLPGFQESLREPSGWWGYATAYFMSHINPPTAIDAVQRAGLQRTDYVLEVGFGDGTAMEECLKHVDKAVGVDMSEHMVGTARARLSKQIEEGRLSLHRGHVEHMDIIESSSIDVAYSLNCVYFWNPIDGALKELYRVLKPGGTLLTFTKFQNLKELDPSIFVNTNFQLVKAGLERCGFVDVQIREVDLGNNQFNYQTIVARKPS
eukprot:comp12336_c0_seq1/m.7195 comp12336_c0_seq1/g.7195  ORF comp12336_c0_seq1/g.7195 comp12336_c0_seq1/m.7195 type:complete len:222 (-) comp12336_c0_seq1:162-827(-)